jgi:hypothetical protein
MENQALNITAIRDETRHKWLTDRRKEMQSSHKKRTLQDYVGSSVPYWLVLIAAVFYLLSAPHTAATFDTLTPGWGWAAPIGVEFGLLFVAFRRKQTKPTAYRGLRWLLILTAILVNGAGSFSAVMDRVGLQGASFIKLATDFYQLPALAVVSLMLVPMMALIIPIGTEVVGHGLAEFVLAQELFTAQDIEREKVLRIDLEQQWKQIERDELYRAFFDALIRQGETPGRAENKAKAFLKGVIITNEQPQLPASGLPQTIADSGLLADEADSSGQTRLRKGEAKQRFEALIQSDPAFVRDPLTSVDDLALRLGVGRSTAGELRKQWVENQVQESVT